jgi:hypothetical protein
VGSLREKRLSKKEAVKIPGTNEAIDKPKTDQSNWVIFKIKELSK